MLNPPTPNQESLPAENESLPLYEPPSVRSYTAQELLAALGPAQAGSVGGDNVFGQ